MQMADYQSERKLVEEARAGSREAFERILDACQDKVYNLVRRMVGAQDAEDVAQEALIEVCKSISGFRGRSRLATWAYRIAVNVCLAHRRRRGPVVVSFDDDFAEHLAGAADDPPAAAVTTQLRSNVANAVAMLPELQRDVVVLHEMQGLTYRECAEVLGCPVGTVKSRLSNAFARLRDLLKEHASESGSAR
jgi:RNA polymerase sigma-70 factor (ECF subfamily)